MPQDESSTTFDPYRPLARNLNRGDALNRWLLMRPRQKIVRLLKGKRVLDVCCGTGNLVAMLVAAGCQVVGVDASPTMLSQARRKQITAEFKQMDAARLPFHREFDAAVISIALHEMPPDVREKVWQSMGRAIHLQGWLIALDFAVPERNSLSARIASRLVEQDERAFLNIHPEHYANYQEFMRSGGLMAWIRKWSQPLLAEYHFWGGTLAAVVAGESVADQKASKSL